MVSFRVCVILLSLRTLLSFDSDSDESHRRRRAHAAHFHHYPSSDSDSIRNDDPVRNDTAAPASPTLTSQEASLNGGSQLGSSMQLHSNATSSNPLQSTPGFSDVAAAALCPRRTALNFSGIPTSSSDASVIVPQQISMTSGQAFLTGSPRESVAAGATLGDSTASRGALDSTELPTPKRLKSGAQSTDGSALDGARNHRMRLNIALSTLASTVAGLPSTEAWAPSEGVATLILSCTETLAPEYTQAELHDTLLAYLVGQGQSALQAGDRIRRLRLWMLQQEGCQHLSYAGQAVFAMSPACAIYHAQVNGYDRHEASCDHVLKSDLCAFNFCQVNQTHIAANHDMRCLDFSNIRCYSFEDVPTKIFWSKSATYHKPWVRRLPAAFKRRRMRSRRTRHAGILSRMLFRLHGSSMDIGNMIYAYFMMHYGGVRFLVVSRFLSWLSAAHSEQTGHGTWQGATMDERCSLCNDSCSTTWAGICMCPGTGRCLTSPLERATWTTQTALTCSQPSLNYDRCQKWTVRIPGTTYIILNVVSSAGSYTSQVAIQEVQVHMDLGISLWLHSSSSRMTSTKQVHVYVLHNHAGCSFCSCSVTGWGQWSTQCPKSDNNLAGARASFRLGCYLPHSLQECLRRLWALVSTSSLTHVSIQGWMCGTVLKRPQCVRHPLLQLCNNDATWQVKTILFAIFIAQYNQGLSGPKSGCSDLQC